LPWTKTTTKTKTKTMINATLVQPIISTRSIYDTGRKSREGFAEWLKRVIAGASSLTNTSSTRKELQVRSLQFNSIHVNSLCPGVRPCCDNCVLKMHNSGGTLTPAETQFLALRSRIESRNMPSITHPVAPPTQAGEQNEAHNGQPGEAPLGVERPETQKKPRHPGPRHAERLEACRNTLTNWRSSTWNRVFKHCIWGPSALLPDAVLTKLATQARLKTLADIQERIPEWGWADEYGEEILKLLEPIDNAWHEENERKKAENKVKRAQLSEENRIKRNEERLLQARQATVQRRAAATTSQHQPVHVPPHYLQVQYPVVQCPAYAYSNSYPNNMYHWPSQHMA
jgi:hypothetical protein